MSATVTEVWDSHRRADYLGRRRPALLVQLPRTVASARSLSDHRREEVLDDAIVWTAYDHRGPIYAEGELEALLWSAVILRVRRAHEGRYSTVRRRFAQADERELEAFPAADGDPADLAQARYETEVLLELARSLRPIERAVLFTRYQRRGADKVYGYPTIARELDLPVKDVRAAMRTIERKLDAFQIVIADRQALAGKLSGLLPAPVIAERAGRPAGWRETLLDWFGRPFGHDAAASATVLAHSGGGRGVGSLAVALCLSGSVAAGGTYCVATGVIPLPKPKPAKASKSRVEQASTNEVLPNRKSPVTNRAVQLHAAAAAAQVIAARERREARARREASERRQARERRQLQARRLQQWSSPGFVDT